MNIRSIISTIYHCLRPIVVKGKNNIIRNRSKIGTGFRIFIEGENNNIEIGKVNANLTPEQIKVAKVQLIYLKANDKNREQVKQKAEQLHQSLVSSATGFYTAAKQHTEADEIETMIGGSDSRTQLKQAVIGLQEGQISPVVAEKDGYYLARCIQADSPELEQEYRNEVVQQKQIDAFQKVYKKWSQKYEVKVSKALLVRE